MSDQEGDPTSLSQSGNASETEPEIMVSVTLLGDSLTSIGSRKPRTKNPTRRTKVFMINEADLLPVSFIRRSMGALGMVGYTTGIVPFTYHHKKFIPLCCLFCNPNTYAKNQGGLANER
ncbi:hypothetical protein RSAG8_07835, partial [Rhizoctonia solani AG-8 WAC10335]